MVCVLACTCFCCNLLQFLSRELSAEWKDVARSLGVKDSTLYQIQSDYSNSTKEIIYQMLSHWKRTKGDKATYSTLVSALEKAGNTDLAGRVQKREGADSIFNVSTSLDLITGFPCSRIVGIVS